MSIPFGQKYKIFLIYFSGTKWQNCAVHICTVLDTLHALQRPAQSRSVRRGRSGIECRPVQRVPAPGRWSVWPCLAWYALVLASPGISGMVCFAADAVQSVRVRWGCGLHRRVYSRRPAPPGQSRRHRKNKKGSKKSPHPHCQSQKFPAKTKRPLQRVWLLCYTCLTSLEREESVMDQKNDKNKEKREKNEKIAASIWGVIIGAAFWFLVCILWHMVFQALYKILAKERKNQK